MTYKSLSRHYGVLYQLRQDGHLRMERVSEDGKLFFQEAEISVSRVNHSHEDDLLGRCEKFNGNLYHIYLREYPVTTDRGEYVFLHEVGHVVARHLEARAQPDHVVEWEADVWTMLRRPAWAEWIGAEMRPRVKRLCEQWEDHHAGPYRWWRALCLDVGFTPDFSRGSTWFD